jgi:hypothetical protein
MVKKLIFFLLANINGQDLYLKANFNAELKAPMEYSDLIKDKDPNQIVEILLKDTVPFKDAKFVTPDEYYGETCDSEEEEQQERSEDDDTF